MVQQPALTGRPGPGRPISQLLLHRKERAPEPPVPLSSISPIQKSDYTHFFGPAPQETQTLLDSSLSSDPFASATVLIFCLPWSLLKFLYPLRCMPYVQCPICKLGMPWGRLTLSDTELVLYWVPQVMV